LTVEWQKYYDDAVAVEKSGNGNGVGSVLLGGQGAAAAGGQGWNTVGGKGAGNKSSNPWGNQHRTSSRSLSLLSPYPPYSSSSRASVVGAYKFEGILMIGGTTAKGVTFHQALKAALDEQSNPQKGG
jgi:hypothetical protein